MVAAYERIVARVVRAEASDGFGLLGLPAGIIGLPPSVIAGSLMTLGGSGLRVVGTRVRAVQHVRHASIGRTDIVAPNRHARLPARVIDSLPPGVIASLVAVRSVHIISCSRAR